MSDDVYCVDAWDGEVLLQLQLSWFSDLKLAALFVQLAQTAEDQTRCVHCCCVVWQCVGNMMINLCADWWCILSYWYRGNLTVELGFYWFICLRSFKLVAAAVADCSWTLNASTLPLQTLSTCWRRCVSQAGTVSFHSRYSIWSFPCLITRSQNMSKY